MQFTDLKTKMTEWTCGGCLVWASAVTLNQIIEVVTLIYLIVQIYTAIPAMINTWHVIKSKFFSKKE